MRHADTAMRRSMADTFAFVHSDAGPSDALHVRHRRVVEVGNVMPVLLQDGEKAHRRRPMADQTGRVAAQEFEGQPADGSGN